MGNPSAWAKSDPAVVERFDAALPNHPAATRGQMFGYPVCYVNGHFFTGLHQDAFIIRLPSAIREQFPELADAPTFDPWGNGKGMRDWYEIPPHIADHQERLVALLDAAVVAVASLPPKAPKRPKAPARAER